MQLLNHEFYYCSLSEDNPIEMHLITKIDCFDVGGNWVDKPLNFDSLF